MKLVIDANILFAALLRDSITAEVLIKDELELFAPAALLIEFSKYQEMIQKRTNRAPEEFQEMLEIFRKRIAIVELERRFVAKAASLSPDVGDIPHLALALQLGIPLWSNDRALMAQQDIPVYSTFLLRRNFLR